MTRLSRETEEPVTDSYTTRQEIEMQYLASVSTSLLQEISRTALKIDKMMKAGRMDNVCKAILPNG